MHMHVILMHVAVVSAAWCLARVLRKAWMGESEPCAPRSGSLPAISLTAPTAVFSEQVYREFAAVVALQRLFLCMSNASYRR